MITVQILDKTFAFNRNSWGPDTTLNLIDEEQKGSMWITYSDCPNPEGGRMLTDLKVAPASAFRDIQDWYKENKVSIDEAIQNLDLRLLIDAWADDQSKESEPEVPEVAPYISDDEEFRRIHGYEEDDGTYGRV